MDIRKQFAKNLHSCMDAKGVRQQDLINDLGYSSATISQWVNGKMFPRPSKVERLAKYLGVSVNDLYAGSDTGEAHPINIYSMDADFEKLAKVALLQKEYIEKLEQELQECDVAVDLYAYVMALKNAGIKEITLKV